LIEWYFLRRANINLANGAPAAQVTAMLEQIETTKGSAVLTEKLGDLYSAQGKPSSAVEMWERALTLEPSPQQRVRLRLALAEKLTSLNRNQEAVDNLAKILQENPDYPAPLEIYKKLLPLAQKLGKTEAAAQYEVLIKQLTPVPLIPK
jgi:tetratricopeptide (TPR) repeat protein